MNNWNEIRKHYAFYQEKIMQCEKYRYAIDPYAWEMDGRSVINMTPIERMMWGDIRSEGIVMYPQYPIMGFFLDFANPKAKVAIECDGRGFHDPQKDAARDAKLMSEGWTVYRMTGSEIYRDGSDDEDGNYTPSPSEAMCRRIGELHKICPRHIPPDEMKPGRMVSMRDAIDEWLAEIRAKREFMKNYPT